MSFFFFEQKAAYEVAKGDWSSEFGSSGLGGGGLGSVGLGRVGVGRVGLGSVGLDGVGLGSVGLGSVGLGRSSSPSGVWEGRGIPPPPNPLAMLIIQHH